METQGHEQPRQLPVVGGHIALDFANTVDDPLGAHRHDHIDDYDDLLMWTALVGAMSVDLLDALRSAAANNPRDARRVVQQAHRLRAGLNELFGAVVDHRPRAAGWTQVRPFLSTAVRSMELTQGVPASFAWPPNRLENPLSVVAMAGLDLVGSPDLVRLKRCAGCPWLFLDQSRNRSRRWCSMTDCGTAQKVRRYVAKRAALH